MGIEKFFNSLVQNETIHKGNLLVLKNKIEADYVYIDFNSILYKIALQIENNLNKLLYELINDMENISEDSQKIAKKWNYKVEKYNLEQFNEFFNDDYIDNNFIKFIIEDINYISGELVNGDKLKKIYISMDGTPNMAKIIEQKKRRYMGYILNESKKEIFTNNKKYLDEKRTIYEENKIKFSRGKILGFHEFMIKVSNELKNEDVVSNLKNKYKSLEKYIFSGSNIPGEGEKKIMEDILENKLTGKYVIYSPDADVIILSSIMINKLNNNSEIYVLRFDQQELKYDIVDIKVLNNNIFNYIDVDSQKNIKKIDVLNDIMYIFTMFGNDFVHKIESIDAKKDFDVLLDAYKFLVSKSNNNIIENDKINYNILKIYINILAQLEKDLLNDVYLVRHYKNYNHLKKQFYGIFWFKTLHRTLINYTIMSNVIFKYLRKWELEFNKKEDYSYWNEKKNRNEVNYIKLQKYIEKNISYLMNELLKCDQTSLKDYKASIKTKFNNSHYIRQFVKIFLLIELNVDLESNNITDKNLYFTFVDIIKKEVFKHNGIKIYTNVIPNIKLEEFKYTTKDKYHSKKIEENLVSDKMTLTSYDYEVYAFEFMLDKYKSKLNAVNDLIAKVNLNYINNQYVYIYDVIEKYHDRYYKIYFGDKYNLKDISEKYFEGICWVFDFYFIKNNSLYNYNNVSPWFYEYHRSPMLIDLIAYLNTKSNKQLLDIHNNTVEEVISREDFFNPMEHYLYVTPKNSINVGKKYKLFEEVINKNKNLFPDLNEIINKIMQIDNETSNYDSDIPIDCRRVSYFSKCTLKTVKDIKYNEFMKVIKPFRGKYKNFEIQYVPYIKKWIQQKGGLVNSTNLVVISEDLCECPLVIQPTLINFICQLLVEMKKKNKVKYLECGDIKYKKIYKMAKKILEEI